MRSNSIIMAAAVVIRWLWGHIPGNKSYDNQLTCYAAGLHHFITSDNTINARRVDDDNARMIFSLASSPPVVSGVAITAATMAPSSSASTMTSLVAGTASRLASTDDGTPPATSSSAMANDDDDDDDNNNNGGVRGVASAASSRPSRWGRTNSTLPPESPVCPVIGPQAMVWAEAAGRYGQRKT